MAVGVPQDGRQRRDVTHGRFFQLREAASHANVERVAAGSQCTTRAYTYHRCATDKIPTNAPTSAGSHEQLYVGRQFAHPRVD
jgi:hypothetical protein